MMILIMLMSILLLILLLMIIILTLMRMMAGGVDSESELVEAHAPALALGIVNRSLDLSVNQ